MRSQHQPEQTFPQFWNAYPRHTNRKYAFKAWMTLDPDAALVETILAALAWQRQSKQWTENDGAYVPHASTYLHGERWTDERPKTTAPALTRFASLGMHREHK